MSTKPEYQIFRCYDRDPEGQRWWFWDCMHYHWKKWERGWAHCELWTHWAFDSSSEPPTPTPANTAPRAEFLTELEKNALSCLVYPGWGYTERLDTIRRFALNSTKELKRENETLAAGMQSLAIENNSLREKNRELLISLAHARSSSPQHCGGES